MARFVRKKADTPLWLLSYADMVTLVLCFMVLLTSLSVIDERLKHDILGSVNKNYASSLVIPLPDDADAFDLAKLQEGQGEELMHGRDFNLLKQQVISDELGDMVFQENRHVQIISLHEGALFEPGTTQLSEKGRTALDRIMPLLVQIRYPLLVAGHASGRMDEEGPTYSIADDDTNPSWKISFERAYTVYAYIVESGVPAEQIRLEAFGEYRPRFSTKTPQGRDRNRRVDLVLDKRNTGISDTLKRTAPQEEKKEKPHEIDGFEFDLRLPGEGLQSQAGRRPYEMMGKSASGLPFGRVYGKA